MESLTACLSRALEGSPQLVLVQGEPGIGKTRLLREFGAVAEARGAGVVLSRCHENLRLPLLPFSDSLFPLLEAAPGWDRSILARLRGQQADAGDRQLQKADLFLAVSKATIQLAQGRPLVLAIDDLQWSDRSSLDLLEHLAFNLADATRAQKIPLLVVATHRRSEPDSAFARALVRFYREEITSRIDLHSFSVLDVDALIRGMGVGAPTPALVEQVLTASQGNPFMVIELVNVIRDGQPGRTATLAAPADLRLPAEFTAPALQRFGALSEDCQALLTQAAVLGFSNSMQALAAVAGLDEDRLPDLVAESEREGLLVAEGDNYRFEHPLVHLAVYRRPPPARRRQLHAHTAVRIEDLWGPEAEDHATEIAGHLIEAGAEADSARMLKYAARAGDAACFGFDWTDAARFYEAAIAAAGTGGLGVAEQARLNYACGYAYLRDGSIPAAHEKYAVAVEGFRALGDTPMLAQALIEEHSAVLEAAGPGGSVDPHPLEELLATLDNRPEIEGPVSAQLADGYLFTGNPELAQDRATRALQAAEGIGDNKTAMYSHLTLARRAYQTLHLRDSWEHYASALADSRELGDQLYRAVPLARAPQALLALGRLDDAEELATEGHDSDKVRGFYGDAALTAAVLSNIAAIRGDFRKADQYGQEGVLLVARSGYRWAVSPVAGALTAARYPVGALAQAEDALNWASSGGAHRLRRLIATYSALARGSPLPAPESAGPSWRQDLDYLPHFMAAIETASLCGDPPASIEAYAALNAAAAEGLLFPIGVPFLVPRILGLMAASHGLDSEAEPHFRNAIEVARSIGARVELARSQLDFARFLLRRPGSGNRQRAIDLVEEAVPVLQELGLEPFLALARGLAGDLGVQLVAEVPAAPATIAYHDQAVLEQAAEGRDERQIAESLTLSQETVRSTLSRMRRRPSEAPATAGPQPGAPDEVRHSIAVILFTDVVDSVQLNERLGDEATHELVQTLHARLLDAIGSNDGDAAPGVLLGDGLLSTFASASQALTAAVQIRRIAEEHKVRLHIGLHAGDVIWEGDKVSGGAVNLASRVRDACPPGQILASNTVRELAMTSTNVTFEDLGMHSLRGVTEPRRLFAVRVFEPKAPQYPDRLSGREVEVLRLLAQGRSNQQIADELVIALNTVLRHVSNVYAKTGAANRAEAVSYAHRHNLAP